MSPCWTLFFAIVSCFSHPICQLLHCLHLWDLCWLKCCRTLCYSETNFIALEKFEIWAIWARRAPTRESVHVCYGRLLFAIIFVNIMLKYEGGNGGKNCLENQVTVISCSFLPSSFSESSILPIVMAACLLATKCHAGQKMNNNGVGKRGKTGKNNLRQVGVYTGWLTIFYY